MRVKTTELPVDLLESVVAAAPVMPKHSALLDALQQIPALGELRYSAMRDGMFWSRAECTVVGEQGESLGRYRDWLTAELQETDGDPVAVWEKHKSGVLRLANAHLKELVFSAAYDDAPESFLQIRLYESAPFIERKLFSDHRDDRPRSVEDLLERGFEFGDTRIAGELPFGAPSYRFKDVVDVARLLAIARRLDARRKQGAEAIHLKLMDPGRKIGQPEQIVSYYDAYPELRALPSREERLFADWQRSSAGLSGARFSDHWYLDHWYQPGEPGPESISMIPQWATAKPPRKIEHKRSLTIYGLYDALTKIDAKAGYPFAWYFYLLHGNRVEDWAGKWVLDGAEKGLIFLPEHDYLVLKQWNEHKYGF